MHKIWAIAWKELYQTLIDRDFLLIMFATPLALSTIIGLAFGGIGADTPTIAKIPVAVVNLDQGLDVGALTQGVVPVSTTQTLSSTADFPAFADGFSFNVGNVIASILLSEPITTGSVISTADANLDISSLSCDLVAAAEEGTTNFQGSLDNLLTTTALIDPAVARQGVERGDYAVAVIIPANFTQHFLPTFTDDVSNSADEAANALEVYGNRGRALSAGIVRSIVESIVNQFLQVTITLEASLETLLDPLELTQIDRNVLPTLLTSGNAEPFAVLGCLFQPGISPIRLEQQPLDALQAGNRFSMVVVAVGSAQAVFFALFTGVFGILSIYEERRQGTLQRMLVSPTTGTTILLGKLLGNVVVVFTQLLLLLLALTLIASLILGTPTFIWGTNLLALLGVLLALSLCVSGIGVLIVGLARTPEQVQVIGPMVNIGLGILGGALGFGLDSDVTKLSLIYWGVDAFEKLAANEGGLASNLLVLVGQGLIFFVLGSWFFRRRLNL